MHANVYKEDALNAKEQRESAVKSDTCLGKYIYIGYGEKKIPQFLKVADTTQVYLNSNHSCGTGMLN